MASLWQIDNAILEIIDQETGEVLDYEKLESLQMERETKIENIALFIKNLMAEAEAIREEEKVLAERRKAKENKAERLKAYLAEKLNGQAFETAKTRIGFRASTGIVVKDNDILLEWLEKHHEDCIKYSLPLVNKAEVAKLIKAGTEVPGAELENRQNIQIK